jgi:putative tryptophan/tyrosine transport system substrate-binding protein
MKLRGGAPEGAAVVGLLLLASCMLPVARLSPAQPSRVGVLSPGAPGPNPYFDAFREGLREQGYVDGQNVTIEFRRTGERRDQFPALAAELVALPVNVLLIAAGTPDILAVKQLAPMIPIVFVTAADPVETGLVPSLARPNGNVTGLTNAAIELGTKRLELLQETVPGLSRVAVIWLATNPANAHELRNMQAAAQALKAEVVSIEIRGPEDLDGAFAGAAAAGAHAAVVVNNPLVFEFRARIAELAAKTRLPAMYENREFVAAGGLMAYGPSFLASMKRAGYYVSRILSGTQPADLPVERPMRFEFVLNQTTARDLGMNFPRSVLEFATDVIE